MARFWAYRQMHADLLRSFATKCLHTHVCMGCNGARPGWHACMQTVDERYESAAEACERTALELTEKVTTAPKGLLDLVQNAMSLVPGLNLLVKK